MSKTYLSQVNKPPILTQQNSWLNWFPALAWLPFPIVINSMIIPPIISAGYWGRWIGLVLLTLFGFQKLFFPGKWQRNNFDRFALLVLLVITISTVYADLEGVLYATNLYETGVFKAFSILLTYLSLTWGLQALLKNLENAKAIIHNLVITATFIYTFGLLANLLKIIPQSLGAYSGIFFNPNTTAALGIVILPLAIWFSSQYKQWGILRFLPTFVIFTATILSEARTPLLAMCVLCIYHLICWSRYKGWGMLEIYGISAIVMSLLLILSIDFWRSHLFTNIYESLTNTNGAGITSFRTNLLWPLFIQEIFSSPLSVLIGHGWGSEEAFLKFQGMQNDFFERWSLGSAHSAYIGLTYQIGLLGSLLTFVPLWFFVINNIYQSNITIDKEKFQFQLALTSTILAELCLCFFESGFFNIGSAHAFAAWLVTYIALKVNDWQIN
ncbi:MAG: hypothetical protein ICV54_07335 [Nostoc sp. C3-bin3]|nr:hypothetical protein [Nostoc sp. C3-bin3]